MSRRVPKEHEYDETGQCKWCPHKDESKGSFAAATGSAFAPITSAEVYEVANQIDRIQAARARSPEKLATEERSLVVMRYCVTVLREEAGRIETRGKPNH